MQATLGTLQRVAPVTGCAAAQCDGHANGERLLLIGTLRRNEQSFPLDGRGRIARSVDDTGQRIRYLARPHITPWRRVADLLHV